MCDDPLILKTDMVKNDDEDMVQFTYEVLTKEKLEMNLKEEICEYSIADCGKQSIGDCNNNERMNGVDKADNDDSISISSNDSIGD